MHLIRLIYTAWQVGFTKGVTVKLEGFIIAAIVMGQELREGVFSQNRVAMELSNDAELVETSFVTRSRTSPSKKLHDKIGSICRVRANRQ